MSVLKFDHVSFVADKKEILKDVSFKVQEGDFISIMGPSGGGKSTLLKLACHLISPTSGSLSYRGKDFLSLEPTDMRKKIAYCFQTPVLFGQTVRENINFPFEIRKEPVNKDKIMKLLEQFQLSADLLEEDVKTLSGGEKQRIALIRTVIYQPDLLLLDEVTSNLDAENSELVEQAICDLHQQGVTIMWITHNQEQSQKVANKRLEIINGSIKKLEALTHERN